MYEDRPGFDYEDGHCLKCHTGHAQEVKSPKTGKLFLGCSNYPKCVNSARISHGHGDFWLSEPDYWEALADADFHDKDWW